MDTTVILSRFGLTAAGGPTVLTGGVDNDNVAVFTDGGRVVIRRYRHSARDKVGAELDLVKFLADNGFPTPGALTTIDGQNFVEAGDVPAAVFEYVPGAPPTEMDPALATEAGRLLARLHDLTDGWTDRRIPVVDRAARLRAAEQTPLGIDGESGWRRMLRRFLDQNVEQLSAMARLPTGPLHHDLHRHNLLVDGEAVFVVDFDELNCGPLIIDVARALFYLAADRDDTTLVPELADALVAGYDSHRRLSPTERELLGVAFEVAALVDAADFLENDAGPMGIGHVTECRSLAVFTSSWSGL